MNIDRLRDDLAGLAEVVTPVDLRDRALATSRRIGIQRAIVTSTTAVVLLAAAAGTAVAIMPRNDNPPTPAGTPTATAMPSPSTVETPDPSTSPTTAPAPDPAAIGQLFYGPDPGPDSGKTSNLYSWTPQSEPRKLLQLFSNTAVANATVSPDGRKVAWVGESLHDAALYVANVDGSGKRKLHDRVDGQCWGPTWAPDSKRLMVAIIESTGGNQYRDRRGVLDIATGDFREVDQEWSGDCHPLWSADGKVVAVPDGGRVMMTDPEAGDRRAIPHLGGGAERTAADVTSISPDGSKIALFVRGSGEPVGDAGRKLSVNAVLDTRTGKQIELPLGGRKLVQAYFQSDGTLVARVQENGGNSLVLISADGKKISEKAEPAQFEGMQILQVAPTAP